MGPSVVSLSPSKKTTGATPTKLLRARGKGATVPHSDKKTSITSASPASLSSSVSAGLGLHQVEVIAASLNELGSRVSQVMEMASTLAQFQTLVGSLRGLPQTPGLWAAIEEAVTGNSLMGANDRDLPIPEGSVRAEEYLEQVFGGKDYPLPPLEEKEKMEVTMRWCVSVAFTASLLSRMKLLKAHPPLLPSTLHPPHPPPTTA